MKDSNRMRSAARNRMACPMLLGLVLTLCFPFPQLSFGADLEVSFERITALDGTTGQERTEFLPGEEIHVRVRLRVLQATGNPFAVRLRISGDGWHDTLSWTSPLGPGRHTITFGGTEQQPLRAAATAAPGKVSLLLDAFSAQDTVSLQGRRHAYLNIRCPPGLPSETTRRLRVGTPPTDMALTADGRYLYVTSEQERKVTVIDVEQKMVAAEIEDPERLGTPTGVAPSPDGLRMLVADSALQSLHVVDAVTPSVIQETIPLNSTGEFGRTRPRDLAVNSARNEAYVADSGAPRIFIVDLSGMREPQAVSLVGPPPLGVSPVQVMPDPDNERFVYVLCQGLNEVIKLDVVSGTITDFVQLRDVSNPASLWPAWSMVLNPVTEEIYVVVNPGIESTDPLRIESTIFVLPKDDLRNLARRRELPLGSSIWGLAVREDGRFVYAVDSYRGEILVIDMRTGTEMSRCAVPVEPGGRFLRADLTRNRLFVGGWLAGFVDIVE